MATSVEAQGNGEHLGMKTARLGISRVSSSASLLGAVAAWIIILGPSIVLLFRISPREISTQFSLPGAFGPLVTSLEASTASLALIVAIGTPLAYRLAKGRLRFGRFLEAGLLASLVMPPLVIGLLLVFLLGPLTPIGSALSHIGLSATNTFFALVVAEIYEAAPYYVLGAQSAFATVGNQLEQDAQILGDRPLAVWKRVTLPLAAPGLSMALAVAWARAIGAFGAVLIIAYHPYGLAMQVWTTLEQSGLRAALPFALLLVVVALPLPLLAYGWSARARARFHS